MIEFKLYHLFLYYKKIILITYDNQDTHSWLLLYQIIICIRHIQQISISLSAYLPAYCMIPLTPSHLVRHWRNVPIKLIIFHSRIPSLYHASFFQWITWLPGFLWFLSSFFQRNHSWLIAKISERRMRSDHFSSVCYKCENIKVITINYYNKCKNKKHSIYSCF